MDEPPAAAAATEPRAATLASATTEGAQKTELAHGRFHRLLPFVSFAIGIASAVTMNRGPRRAALVAVAAGGCWLTLLLLHWLARPERAEAAPAAAAGFWQRALRRSSLIATQSAVQFSLFFALPFYAHAATREPVHLVFLGVLGLMSLATLWDPLTEWLLLRALLAPLLPAGATFVALNAVLPGLGLSTHTSLRVAAGVAVLGVAALAAGSAQPGKRARAFLRAFGLSLALPLALELGGARIVPAAPLRLIKIEIGTQIHDRELVDPSERMHQLPSQLFCATSIASPVGVKDRLFHVWRYGGAERARIELRFRGGRSGGFRTFSRIDGFGAHAAGSYSCSVETASGQLLGSRGVRIGD